MKKISRESIYYLKYFHPYLILFAMLSIIAVFLFLRIYPAVIIIAPIFIFGILFSNFFIQFRKLCEVYIDFENRIFKIYDFKSEYFISFDKLIKVKTKYLGNIVILYFRDKKIYFSPIQTSLYFPGSDELIKDMKLITKDNK